MFPVGWKSDCWAFSMTLAGPFYRHPWPANRGHQDSRMRSQEPESLCPHPGSRAFCRQLLPTLLLAGGSLLADIGLKRQRKQVFLWGGHFRSGFYNVLELWTSLGAWRPLLFLTLFSPFVTVSDIGSSDLIEVAWLLFSVSLSVY